MANNESGEKVAVRAYASSVDSKDLVRVTPEEIGLVDVVGDPAMLAHELRSDNDVWAAVFTVEPCAFNYVFAGDETIHVLEGEGAIAVDGAQTIELRPGTIASFPKGAHASWRIDKRLREFIIMTGT